MEEFIRLDRKLVHKGKIFEYYQDTVKIPNGNEVIWDFIKHKGAAAVVPVMEDGKILMVSQWRNALDRYTLEIPAGGLNLDGMEPTITAARRELEEETGYKTEEDLEFLISIIPVGAYSSEKIDIFVARNLVKSVQNLDDDEFISVQAMSIDEITKMIYEGSIKDSKTISAIMSYKDKYINRNSN